MRSASSVYLFAALLSVALLSAASAQELDCAKCHEQTEITGPEDHQDLSCTECHVGIEAVPGKEKFRNPHQENALKLFPPEKICAECHDGTLAKMNDSIHSDLSCAKCHGSVHKGFRFEADSCTDCHQDTRKKHAGSVHGEDVSCAECHGDPHSIVEVSDPASPVYPVNQPKSCAACHEQDGVVAGFIDSEHGRGVLKSGLKAAPSCSTCHGSHDILKVDDAKSSLSPKKQPEACGACHTLVLAQFKESVHGEHWKKGEDEEGPVCSSCHAEHHINDPKSAKNRLSTPQKCGNCHEEAYKTYREGFHGQATHLGLSVAAVCSDCHSAHHMLPAKDPRSTVHPDNLQATCASCHPGIGPKFTSYNPHLDPTKVEDSAPVHYTWLFMTILLVGTFGAFFIHSLLWVQRLIVASIRGELHKIHRTGDVWVRRFRPVHQWIHITIIITFLLLALTGLPLKFSVNPVALFFSDVLGGLDVTRFLHRVAGVATFGYAGFFLGYLIREIVVKKRRELLFGWKSMTPSGQDLKDIIANVKWFLYLGPQPKLGRWTYWEKFDFFAVFWGVPVIGFSGLLLWFPREFTYVLPGWALNLAYVIHSDEALLATGFIFVFHFFHTHLRPENFPMDPVMFTGSMPLERLKEERPAEYEELVRTGELQQLIVPAPSEFHRRAGTIFGFIALGTGVLLAVFLIYSGIRILF